jgi:hypothetical protein
MKKTYALLLLLPFSACLDDAPESAQDKESRPELVRAVESAHHKTDFLSRETVAFDLELNWRGKAPLHCGIVQRTDGTRIRVRKANGSDILFDGSTAWMAGDTKGDPEARFDLFAWHYFFCLPWKLADPGARWQPMPDRVFDGHPCSAGRLTFAPGTGDSADDWFLVFSDKKDGLIRGAVYVVTYGGKDIEAAEKGPRSIEYGDYRPVDGIPVAHAWTFHGWNTDSLDSKTKLGEARIRNVRFEAETPEMFALPPGAAKI